MKRMRASDLYREGRFNIANFRRQSDGSMIVVCDGVQAPRPYTFRARNFLAPQEEILEDQDVELEPQPAPAPAQGPQDSPEP